MNNYTVYHLHSDYSILDATTKYYQHIDKAIELGMKSVGFTEHGNIYNWVKKKQYCDKIEIKCCDCGEVINKDTEECTECGSGNIDYIKKPIKYMHGCEFYLTEKLEPKVRDNYHTILYAKNSDGVKELNALVSKSGEEDHFYYSPRISFDEFLETSDNIISTSACLASPLNKLDYNNPYYEKLINKYDYLEIQPHENSEDQNQYNQYLYMLSEKYNKKLILGTDTHELNHYQQECRNILKDYKGSSYGNEDEFDLSFHSYDDIIKKCKSQNSFDIEIYKEAIKNTNELSESIRDFELDDSFKYPEIYTDVENKFKKFLNSKFKERIKEGALDNSKLDEYKKRLRKETEGFSSQNMLSFMMFLGELSDWCWKNNIPIGYGRGSVTGSTVAYILRITDVDPVRWNTIFSRFFSTSRVSLADVDLDFAPQDRKKVFDYIGKRFGEDKTSFIITFDTMADRGTIDCIGGALDYDLGKLKKIKNEYEDNPEKTRNKYPDIFKYFDGLYGVNMTKGRHAAGIIGSPVSLSDNLGVFYDDGKPISQCDMKAIDSLNYVKYDILGLKNIGILKNVYELLEVDYKMSHEINWKDKEVWKDITSLSAGIFQFEGDYSFSLLKKFNPKKINDLSIANGIIRPSAESFRDDILDRNFHHNPTKEIDKLLKDNYGYLIFQEDTIRFLTDICGMDGGEADLVRRGIGKKDEKLLSRMIPKVKEGYIANSDKSKATALKEVEEFLTVIKDAVSYQFGYNHSTAYSMIGYTCAYWRYYKPLEFTTAFFNNASESKDLSMGRKLCSRYGIEVKPPTYGKSKAKYFFDDNGNIYKGVHSIKNLNAEVGDKLYEMRDVDSFPAILDLKQHMGFMNKTHVETLIKVGYFRNFGSRKKLLEYYKIHDDLSGRKIIFKTKLNEYDDSLKSLIIKYADRETAKQYRDIDFDKVLIEYFDTIPNDEVDKTTLIEWELEFLGYTNIDIPKGVRLIKIESNKYYGKVWANNIKNSKPSSKIKVPKKYKMKKDQFWIVKLKKYSWDFETDDGERKKGTGLKVIKAKLILDK